MKKSLLPAVILFLAYGLLLHWPRPLDVSLKVDAAGMPPLDIASADFLAELNRHGLRHVPTAENLAAGLFETMVPGEWSNDGTMENPGGKATAVALGIELAGSDRQLESYPVGYDIIFEQPWTAAQIPVAAAWLDRQQALLNEIQPLLKRERYFQYYHSNNGQLISALLPLPGSARSISRAYLARAMHALAENRLEDAGRDILAVLQLGERLGQGYFILETLVGIAVQEMANQAVCQWLSHPQLTAELLDNFKADLATIPAPRLPVQAFDLAERFAALGISQAIQRQGAAGLAAVTGAHVNNPVLVDLQLSLADWNEVFRLQNDRFDRLVQILKIENRRQRRAAVDEFRQQMTEELRNAGISRSGFLGMTFSLRSGSLLDASRNVELALTSIMLPTSVKAIERVDQSLMSRQAIETCIAVRQYQLENRAYPENLEILLGDFLPSIPNDIKVDQPLRYRKLEKGALLYSVGPSGTDNGGWFYPSWDPSRDDRVFLVGKDDRTDVLGNPVERTLLPGEHYYNERGGLELIAFAGWDIDGLEMQELARLSSLRSLDFTLTRISDEDLAILASRDGGGDGLLNLHQLSLGSTPVSDDGLAELGKVTSLQNLQLPHTGVTSAGLVHLAGLTNLQTLILDNTEITDDGLVHLKNLTNLQLLVLDNTEITDDGLVHLKNLTSLKSLSLTGTQITDTGLLHLQAIAHPRPQLGQLWLSRTRVSDAGLVHLKELSNLYGLALSSTGVTDAGLSQLAGLTRLRDLHLQGTAVTESGRAHFQDNPNLNLHVYEKPESEVKFEPSRVIEGWGSVIDPDGDCSISRHADELIISVPGVVDYSQSRPKQMGQYVRLDLPGDDKILSVAEIEVFQDGKNIASEGTITQSSTDLGGDAEKANDGNTSGVYYLDQRKGSKEPVPHSVTHTKKEKDPWIEIDLGRRRPIDMVRVWNRTDLELHSRLDGFVLSVHDENRELVWQETHARAAGRPHGLYPARHTLRHADRLLWHLGQFNAPRVLKNVTGDFSFTVNVSMGLEPGRSSRSDFYSEFHGAGILIWDSKHLFATAERNIFTTYQPGSRDAPGYDLPRSWINARAFHYGSDMFHVHWGAARFFGEAASRLRVERKGMQLTFSLQRDSLQWIETGKVSLPLSESVQVGVMVSNASKKEVTAIFSDYELVTPASNP